MIARPRRDHLWLKKLDAEKLTNKIGSIWLPDQAMDTQQMLAGEIVALGPDVLEQPPIGTLAPGLRVIIKHLRGDPVTLRAADYDAYGLERGELVLLVQEDDIQGVLTSPDDGAIMDAQTKNLHGEHQ